MKEEEKYYTPKIEEFHVGFKVEVLSELTDTWINYTIDKDDCLGTWDMSLDKTRVKWLDKEDIENEGWKFVSKFENEYWPHEDYKLEIKDEITFVFHLRWRYTYKCSNLYKNITILKDDLHRCTDENGEKKKRMLFEGRVKNKSELKKLMQQLNIT